MKATAQILIEVPVEIDDKFKVLDTSDCSVNYDNDFDKECLDEAEIKALQPIRINNLKVLGCMCVFNEFVMAKREWLD